MSTEVAQIGGLPVEIVRKAIRNLHIGCYPPEGRVRVAAPKGMSEDAIRMAVLSRLPWIRRKQNQFQGQEREVPRQYVSGETHLLFGRSLRLQVETWPKKTHRVSRYGSDRLLLSVPAEHTPDQRRRWMDAWSKSELKKFVAPRVASWSERLAVEPKAWGIRVMRTKWGSCNPIKGIVWLNLELVKKPERMIDYVVLHELAHLVSRRHDDRFIEVLDREMPQWRQVRAELNALSIPVWN